MKLTSKQLRFIDEYLIDHNATQAAVRAGYAKRSAQQSSARLMLKDVIQEKIAERVAEIAGENKATVKRIIKELCAIAFTKLTDIVYIDGNKRVKVKPTSQLTDDQQRAIESISQTQYGVKIKMHDKTKALELLGRHLGMWLDRVEVGKDSKAKGLTEEQLRAIIDDDPED